MALKIAVRPARKLVATLDAREAILADDAAPQCVVEIQHHAFLRTDRFRRHHSAEHPPDLLPEGFSVRLAVQLPFANVVRLPHARVQHESMKVEQSYAFHLG